MSLFSCQGHNKNYIMLTIIKNSIKSIEVKINKFLKYKFIKGIKINIIINISFDLIKKIKESWS